MAASGSTVGGYEYELFTSPVPDDFKCGLCKKVARDANLTTCCGEQFCKACIEQALKDDIPCPSCKEPNVAFVINKRDQKRILALEVRCAMKGRGCEWNGVLEHLSAHLDVNSDDCQYVDTKCPNKCDHPVQKRNLPTHLAKECPKRDFFCQYCNFTATYEVVCNDHWPECPFYPIPCPNGCRILAIERGDLDAHLMLCSLEEVTCDFSYAGCNVKLEREEMEKHLADNLQRHVLMMNKAVRGEMEEKERKIEELEVKLEERDRQIQEVRDENKEVQAKMKVEFLAKEKQVEAKVARVEEQLKETEERQMKELQRRESGERDRQIQEVRDENKQIQEVQEEKDRQIQDLREEIQEVQAKMKVEFQAKEQQIKEIEAKVARVEEQLKMTEERRMKELQRRESRVLVTMPNFQRLKTTDLCWSSPPQYTHPGGYKFTLLVNSNGWGEDAGTHVSVYLQTAVGENDDQLKWPADCTILLQLLNQHRDQDHIIVSKQFQWDKPSGKITLRLFDFRFIAHKDLGWNAEKQTQYLKNDSLQFRVIEVHIT